MSRGGKRQGSGRPRGAATKRTQEIVAKATAAGLMPLEYMLNILRDDEAPPDQRFEAAKQAAPYLHPRLAAVEHSGEMTINKQEAALSEIETIIATNGRGNGFSQ